MSAPVGYACDWKIILVQGRAAVAGMTAGVVAICFALLVWCGGSWDYLGPPVNYFGCGTDRPDGISAEGLVGAYTTVDGVRLGFTRMGH